MPPDLIVYALIAAGLVFWLRSVLGTRHGDERERHNPYTPQENSADKSTENAYIADERPPGPQELITELSENAKGAMSVENKTAEAGLLDIASADKDFDITHFLEGAQDAFVIIVESFAAGDRETLEGLSDKSVYDAFESVIAEREKKEEHHESEIHAIKKAEVTEAVIKNKAAYITVRFTADETSVTRDKEGEIISGHPDKITEMRDIWVFGREIKSRDPRWFVYETRGDVAEGDNETIPNTD